MIKRKMKSVHSGWNWRHKVEDDIYHYEEVTGRSVDTKEDLLDYLFGNYEHRPDTSLDLYLLEPVDKKWYHRLNMFWAYPVTLLLYPFRYVIYGDGGWTNKTIMGKFMLKSVGEDK